jgi:hypothetical protein
VRRRNESDRLRVRGIRRELLTEGLGVEPGRVPMVNRDQQLIDGEPVECMALELPPMASRYEQLGFEPFDRLRVDPDDTITVVAKQPPPIIDEAWADP